MKEKKHNKDDKDSFISIYIDRIDAVFGITYIAISPNHKNIKNLISSKQKESCNKYIRYIKDEKGELPTPSKGGHNVQAKPSSSNIIFENIHEVNK